MGIITIMTDTLGAEAMLNFIENYNAEKAEYEDIIRVINRDEPRSKWDDLILISSKLDGYRGIGHVHEAHEHHPFVLGGRPDFNAAEIGDFGRRGEHGFIGAKHLLGMLDDMQEGLVLSPKFGREPETFYLRNHLADLEYPDFVLDLPERSESSFKHWWTPNEQSKERRKDKSVIWVKARAKAKRAKQARKQHRRK